jgi:hypothetical protein
MFDLRKELEDTLQTADEQISHIQRLKKECNAALHPMQTEQLTQLTAYRQSLQEALSRYQWTTAHVWVYQWSFVFVAFLMTLFEAVAIFIYAHWHSVNLISAELYSPAQIDILSRIGFVNGPTTMSIVAEILMWSSLGVWASYAYQFGRLMLRREFRFGDHGPMYISHLVRNTSVVAAVILLLRLSQFSMFGISIGDDTQLGFDSTIGLAFLLGFFGDDATRLLLNLKDVVLGQAKNREEDAKYTS